MSSLSEFVENHHDHTNHIETIIAISIASASCCLSIFGSLLILGTYYFYPEIRKPARDLLFWLSVTDLGTAISYGMTFIMCGGTCDCEPIWQEVYSVLGIYFPVSSFLWTDCIGLYIYAATYQKTWMAPRERLFCIFHIICWGLPMLTCVAIIILRALPMSYPIILGGSATGGWCWIQQWQYDLLGGKVIEIFSYFFLLVCYVWTWKELKRINYRNSSADNNIAHSGASGKRFSATPLPYIHPTPSSTQNQSITNSMLKDSRADDMRKQLQHKSAAVNRLLFIPVVFFALRIWGTTHMFMDVGPDSDTGKHDALGIIDHILAYSQALCDPLQGFCNGILFVVFVSEVRQHLYNTLQEYIDYKWLNCCGLICCCHYCFSCCCQKCNECFDCCLIRNKQYINNTQNVMNNANTFNNKSANGTSPLQTINTDYYASQYQFLPQNQNQIVENSNHTDTSPSKSNSKSKSLVCKGGGNGNNYSSNAMINPNHPTIESPSISSIK